MDLIPIDLSHYIINILPSNISHNIQCFKITYCNSELLSTGKQIKINSRTYFKII